MYGRALALFTHFSPSSSSASRLLVFPSSFLPVSFISFLFFLMLQSLFFSPSSSCFIPSFPVLHSVVQCHLFFPCSFCFLPSACFFLPFSVLGMVYLPYLLDSKTSSPHPLHSAWGEIKSLLLDLSTGGSWSTAPVATIVPTPSFDVGVIQVKRRWGERGPSCGGGKP